MAKLKGPALSLTASGKLGDAVVYSIWRGRPYAKHAKTPANPNTAPQIGARAMLKFLSMNYATLSPTQILTWAEVGNAETISAYNAFCKYNLQRWNSYWLPTKTYPADESAPASLLVFALAVAKLRGLDLIIQRGTANLGWGTAIHRSTVSGFTPSSANCIQVIYWPWAGAAEYTYHDPKLSSGTYYYRLGPFSETGRNTPAFATQITGVVT